MKKAKGFIPFALDIGHGIDNPKSFKDLSEYDWNQKLAEVVIPLAVENGLLPVLAQGFNEKTVGLVKRYPIYKDCVCGVSIHVDAHRNQAVNGLSVYHWITSKNGLKFAEIYEDEFKNQECPIRFMKLDEADTDPSDGTYDNMGILRETAPPFILVEHGYKTNVGDREYLNSDKSVDLFAEVLVRSVCRFVGKEFIKNEAHKIMSMKEIEELEKIKNAIRVLRTV